MTTLIYDPENPIPYIDARIRAAFEAAGYTDVGIERDDELTNVFAKIDTNPVHFDFMPDSDDDGSMEFVEIEWGFLTVTVVLFPED